MFKWSYLKFSVLCILVETIVVSTAPAKHWFWIIWTDFAASVTSLSVQSEIYLNWTCINFCMKFFVWVLFAIFLEINKTLISIESLLPIKFLSDRIIRSITNCPSDFNTKSFAQDGHVVRCQFCREIFCCELNFEWVPPAALSLKFSWKMKN